MPVVRILVSYRQLMSSAIRDAFTNTLYFNVSGSLDEPGYQGLVDDVKALYYATEWGKGRYFDVRAYDMADPDPKPQKARSTGTAPGTAINSVGQVALALSYFADRNLPRQRGRIFLGPWDLTSTASSRPTTAQQQLLINFGQGLAGIGGLNVDWSLHSPSNNDTTRISDIWVDNSWDVIRSRKASGTSRLSAQING